eukprot:CAMPEP_0203665738 /NCGR_PEP_ID=MMETSP0090-20130426/2903_1 /ASSEMBLY_ACC=CAM_ASM_001088 /TAXON_ID=426623 /ORGANISM="Chaetoceros affinis, Strain CCMP159" /LENGTH=253 /DNA_ID=CAMNT_0050529399 /DNA_START=100 /DNA_END=861 /DNA_ORIENTATION=-
MTKNQLENLIASANIERERKKESQYFELFTDLLKRKKGSIISNVAVGDSADYATETKTLKKLLKVESDALIGGFVVGIVAFSSIRILPRLAIRLIGGESKMKTFRDSENASRKSPNAFLKRGGSFLFEGMIGFWAGWRGYHVAASMQGEDVIEDITNIPLTQGRSITSDEICSELSNLVRNEIPNEFWQNLEQEDNLKHESSWRNIIRFSDNCIKRKAFEDILRAKNGIKDNEPVIIPPPGVPEDILEKTKYR